MTSLPTRLEGAAAGSRELDALDQELIDRSFRTVQAYDAVRLLQAALLDTMKRQHTGYDWNADPDQMTLKQGKALALATKVFADLSAAVDAHPDFSDEVLEAVTVECQSCGGTGTIVEEARTHGANQHSACQQPCEDCNGTGRAHAEQVQG